MLSALDAAIVGAFLVYCIATGLRSRGVSSRIGETVASRVREVVL